MPNERHLKRLISDAVFEAHNTHGRQAGGDRLFISREDSRIIASAVFDAMRRANVLEAPLHRAIERIGIITSQPVLGGLHHQYCRI